MGLTKIFVAALMLCLLLLFMANPERTLDRIGARFDQWGESFFERANRDPDRTSAVIFVIVLGFVFWAVAKAKPWGGGGKGGKGE